MLEQSERSQAETLFRWFQVRRLTPPTRVRELLAPELGDGDPLLRRGWELARRGLQELLDLAEPWTEVMPVIEVAGYLSPVLLRDSDAMSMYHSLELRIPFLDTDMVRLALRYSLRDLVNLRSGKQPIRRAVAGHVPATVVTRKKQGFGAPVGAWLHYPPVREAVLEEFCSPPRQARELLSSEELRRLGKRFYDDVTSASRYRLVSRVWMTFSLLRWTRMMAAHS